MLTRVKSVTLRILKSRQMSRPHYCPSGINARTTTSDICKFQEIAAHLRRRKYHTFKFREMAAVSPTLMFVSDMKTIHATQ